MFLKYYYIQAHSSRIQSVLEQYRYAFVDETDRHTLETCHALALSHELDSKHDLENAVVGGSGGSVTGGNNYEGDIRLGAVYDSGSKDTCFAAATAAFHSAKSDLLQV